MLLLEPVNVAFIITLITYYFIHFRNTSVGLFYYYLTFELFSTTIQNTMIQLYNASVKSGAFHKTENAL